jgi:hypothetical protein
LSKEGYGSKKGCSVNDDNDDDDDDVGLCSFSRISSFPDFSAEVKNGGVIPPLLHISSWH